MTAIEFTDRYGGHSPSWLRTCNGQCEAMGSYPVEYTQDTNDLTPQELAAVKQHIAVHGKSEDNYYFIKCSECNGTGNVSMWTTLSRVPTWIVRGFQILHNIRPSSEYWQGHPASYVQKLWVNFKVAFLADLGVRM
jgi:hypothetical protein